ncbi:MAG: alpha/beta fold hydrolase [Thermomicrobiales bacterium]
MGYTRFAQNDLARLSYEVSSATGSGTDATPTVVLLHATLTEHASLNPLREELVERFQVVQPDARGHGASAALTDRSFTVTDMANDLYVVLEAADLLGPDKPPLHLVGHGQGAIAALELARRRPDLVTSLVLIEPDAPALLDSELDVEIARVREEARTSFRAASDAAYKGLTDKALGIYLNRRWGEGWEARLTKPRLAAVRRHITALSPSLDALDRYRLLPEELAAITIPALVVVAAESPVAERAIAQRVAETIPSATLRVVTSLPGGAPLTGNGEIAISVITEWLATHA